MTDKVEPHHVLRQPLAAKILFWTLGGLGSGLAVWATVAGGLDSSLKATDALQFLGLFAGSAGLGLYYPTTEVHATPSRLWLRRYGVTWWSVDLREAGTSEGRGDDWRFVNVFDLRTGKRIGRINWFMFDRREVLAFSAFIDSARESLGVTLDPPAA